MENSRKDVLADRGGFETPSPVGQHLPVRQ